MRLRLIKKEKQQLAVKLVVVGDGMVGKTSLLLAYMRDQFDDTYEPTVFETSTKEVVLPSVSHRTIQLTAEDTAGQETYEHFRPFAYANVDVILLCFSLDSPDSLANVPQKWMPELRHYCPEVPIVLVGTKVDLRFTDEDPDKPRNSVLATDEAAKTAGEIGAPYYIECSAKTRQNINEVFQKAIATAVKKQKRRQTSKLTSRCTIL